MKDDDPSSVRTNLEPDSAFSPACQVCRWAWARPCMVLLRSRKDHYRTLRFVRACLYFLPTAQILHHGVLVSWCLGGSETCFRSVLSSSPPKNHCSINESTVHQRPRCSGASPPKSRKVFKSFYLCHVEAMRVQRTYDWSGAIDGFCLNLNMFHKSI